MIKKVIFHGFVQGVGFRYKTHNISKNYDVRGYVKNLSNGCVELVAVGNPNEIDAFITDIKKYFSTNISNVEFLNFNGNPTFSSFDIKF